MARRRCSRPAPPGTLFLSGGNTPQLICDLLGATDIQLKGEVSTGISCGRLNGGLADGITVILKSGGFGNNDEFADITSLAEWVVVGDATILRMTRPGWSPNVSQTRIDDLAQFDKHDIRVGAMNATAGRAAITYIRHAPAAGARMLIQNGPSALDIVAGRDAGASVFEDTWKIDQA